MAIENATTFKTPAADDPALIEAARRLVAAYQPDLVTSSVPLPAATQGPTAI